MSVPIRLLHETLIRTARARPEKTAVVVDGCSYSYEALLSSSRQAAVGLNRLGVNRGDRVAIMLDNSWESLVTIYGCLQLGSVFVMVNPQTKAEKLQYLLEHSGAKALVTQQNAQRVSQSAVVSLPKVQVVVKLENAELLQQYWCVWTDLLRSNDELGLPAPIASDLAAIIYTSGSTGKPKGVMHTHLSMVFALHSLLEYLELAAGDRIMCALPLAFDYGLYQALMSVAVGATLVIERSFAYPVQVFDTMLREKVTVFPGVPTMFAMMTSANRRRELRFPTVQRVTNTAAALLPNAIPELRNIFPNAHIYKMYGLTECKRVCYLPPALLEAHPASVGVAIPGTQVYLKSAEGEVLSAPGEGILHVRGPHVMAGYWRDPEASDRMLVPGNLPGERHLCTHDLFRMDEQGLLYFVGRTDDIIKSRGEKVAPLEVENVLLRVPGVQEAAVLGVPDDTAGEIVCGFISFDDANEPNEKQLRKFCASHLENYMVPTKFVFLDSLPKSENGKIDKLSLKAMA